MNRPDISVALPVFNEVENLDELNERLLRVLTATGRTWEIVYVDDGSSDASFEKMAAFARQDPRVRDRKSVV